MMAGVAVAPLLMANATSGAYGMNATVAGAGTVTFSLSNDPPPVYGPACLVDTTQADFDKGVATLLDTSAIPGSVILLNPMELDQQNTTLGKFWRRVRQRPVGRPDVHADGHRQARQGRCKTVCRVAAERCWTCWYRSGKHTTEFRPDLILATATIVGFSNGGAVFYTASFGSPGMLTAAVKYAVVIRAGDLIRSPCPVRDRPERDAGLGR